MAVNKEIEDLKKEVADLTKRLDALTSPTDIPLDVETAFQGRGFVSLELITDPFTSYGSQTLGNDRNIDTGLTPEFTILEYPIYWGKIKGPNNQAMFIPIYINPELGLF